ncbi:hypothetical protein SDC9_211325 [bioreactor metagenome]|uniref:Uncharacterized protein n=1 Tax=bioreactor metagenome TaxID=1076179 RepID=A0A645JIY1_9ZZZZ
MRSRGRIMWASPSASFRKKIIKQKKNSTGQTSRHCAQAARSSWSWPVICRFWGKSWWRPLKTASSTSIRRSSPLFAAWGITACTCMRPSSPTAQKSRARPCIWWTAERIPAPSSCRKRCPSFRGIPRRRCSSG